MVGGGRESVAAENVAYRIGTVFGQRSQLWYHLPAADSFELLGRIYESGGDVARARAHHEAALATYDRIGAVVDAADERAVLTTPDLA